MVSTVRETPRCRGCGRIMSWREADEQGACNDCYGGAWSPAESSAEGPFATPTGAATAGRPLSFSQAVAVRAAYAFGDWRPARP